MWASKFLGMRVHSSIGEWESHGTYTNPNLREAGPLNHHDGIVDSDQ